MIKKYNLMIILIFTNIFMGNALSEKNFFLDAKKKL